LVAVALTVFDQRSAWWALGGWLLAVATFYVVHPTSVNHSLETAFAVAEIVATVCATVLLLGKYRRTHEAMSSHQWVMAIVRHRCAGGEPAQS
jgi:hypothetical protein